jgi:hypothetical protein
MYLSAKGHHRDRREEGRWIRERGREGGDRESKEKDNEKKRENTRNIKPMRSQVRVPSS